MDAVECAGEYEVVVRGQRAGPRETQCAHGLLGLCGVCCAPRSRGRKGTVVDQGAGFGYDHESEDGHGDGEEDRDAVG